MRCNFGSGVNQVSVTPEELIVTANVRTHRTVIAKNFVGDGGLLSNIYVANAAIPGIIYADVFGNLTGANATLTGNASAAYFLGNGALLTGIVVGNASLPKTIAADLVGNVRGGNATVARVVVDTGAAFPTESAFPGQPAYVEGPLLDQALGLDPPGVRVRASTNQNLGGWATNAMFMAHAATGVRRRCFQTVMGGNVATGNSAPGDVTSYIDSYGVGYFGNAVSAASLSATGNVSASFFSGNGSLLTGVLVANAGLPRTIAADLSGNVTGANATIGGGLTASSVVFGSGAVTANSQGLFTAAAYNAGYVYADTLALGTPSSVVGFWRTSDGLLSATNATLSGRLTVNGLGSEFTGNQFYLKRVDGDPAPIWEQYSMVAQPISIATAGGIYMAAGSLWTSSDARKKFDVEAASPEACAEAVRASRLVSYATLETGGRQVGFIAQQVANVVPGCVTLAEQAVPSVMRLAVVATPRSFVLEGASEKLAGEHVVGVRLVLRGGSTLDANVASVAGDVVTLEDAALTGSEVFVYGPVVDDFNTLDYQRMWGTAFGAVQHLLSKGDESESRLAALEASVRAVERRGLRRAAARAMRRLTACFSSRVTE